MSNTFRALCDLADWDSPLIPPTAAVSTDHEEAPSQMRDNDSNVSAPKSAKPLQLHYNIQVHLPESRDPAVFDAIFQALRRHLT
jgi:hypothetical protein